MFKLLPSLLFTIVLITGFAQCARTVDSELKKVAEVANKQCPRSVDQYTRLDSVAAIPGETYRFYYTLSIAITDVPTIKENLKNELIKNIQIDPSMKFFRENHVTMQYRYNDGVGNNDFEINIAPYEYK